MGIFPSKQTAFAALIFAFAVQAPAQSPQRSLGLLPFADATASGPTTAGVMLSRMLQAELLKSTALAGRVIPIPDVVRPEQIDRQKAIEFGRPENVDMILIGTILEATAEESARSGWTPSIVRQSVGVSLRSVKAAVTLQAVILDVATGNQVTALKVTGRHADRRFGGTLYSNLGSWSSNDQRFLESPLGKAMRAAVLDLVKQIAAAATARKE